MSSDHRPATARRAFSDGPLPGWLPQAISEGSSVKLSGAGAQGERHAGPGGEVRERRRQGQDDAARRDDYMGTELDEPLAQGADLGPGAGGARGAQAEFLHEDISG